MGGCGKTRVDHDEWQWPEDCIGAPPPKWIYEAAAKYPSAGGIRFETDCLDPYAIAVVPGGVMIARPHSIIGRAVDGTLYTRFGYPQIDKTEFMENRTYQNMMKIAIERQR